MSDKNPSNSNRCFFFLCLQQMKHIDFNLAFLLIGIVTGISNIFFYCYFGKLSTDCYSEIPGLLFESDWYLLSVCKQKYILLMIQNAQIPLYYHGYKMAVLDLRTFSMVIVKFSFVIAFDYFFLNLESPS